MILLETVHGSHLYGLATPSSDRDSYQVVDKLGSGRRLRNVKQTIVGDEDKLVIALTDFMRDADDGNPKALEAMFSPLATGPLKAMANSYVMNGTAARKHYHKIIHNFAYLSLQDETLRELLIPVYGEEEKVFTSLGKHARSDLITKYRRHSVRLLLNLETGLGSGRFNPVLSEEQKQLVYSTAHLPEEDFVTYLLGKLST